MKKLFVMVLASLLLLTACNDQELPKEEVEENSQEESVGSEEEMQEPAEKPQETVEDPGAGAEDEGSDSDTTGVNQESGTPQALSEEKVKEMIEYYGVGEGDQLSDVSFRNGEIKATIGLASNEMFSAKDLAVNRYSQLSDEFLNHQGWDILTITFAGIGTVSMNRNEKESNEFY